MVVVFTILMTMISSLQIVTRSMFNVPLSWSEEGATYLFIWWVFLGAALAVRSESHLGMDILTIRLPAKVVSFLKALVYFAIFLYTCAMMGFGGKLVWITMGDLTPITRIPFGVLFLIQPICGFCMAVFIIGSVVQMWTSSSKE